MHIVKRAFTAQRMNAVDGNARLAGMLVGVGRLTEPQHAPYRRGDTRP